MTVLTPEQIQIIQENCKDTAAADAVIQLVQQITEPQDLTADPRFVRRILQASPSLIYVYDLVIKRYIYSNYNLTRMLGYTWEQISSMGDLITVLLAHPDDLAHLLDYYIEAAHAADGMVLSVECRVKHADGHWVWLHSQETVFRRNPDGSVWQILGLAHDVTALKETEAALRHSEARHRAIMDTQEDLIARYDLDLRITYANEAFCRFVGIPAEQLHGLSIEALSPEIDWDSMREKLQTFLVSGQKYMEERVTVNAEGEPRWIQWIAQPIVDNWGQVIEIQSTGRDLTERKTAENALREAESALRRSQSLYQILVRNLPDTAVMLYDSDLRYLLVEGSMLATYGYSKEQMEGKTLPEVVPPQSAAELMPLYRAALAGQEIHFERRAGESVFDVHIVPIFDDDGQPAAGLLVIRDVTEQEKHQQQILQFEMEKERVRLLSDFIRDTSHEFRTPLTIIGSSAHLLAKATEPEKRQKHLRRITEQVENLTWLVDDLLEMSRLARGGALQTEPVDINSITQLILASQQPAIQNKRQQVRFQLDESLPDVQGDPRSIESAVKHILDNAIRYTPEDGQITVSSFVDGSFAVLRVADSGVGMDTETVAHIFDTFYRADAAHTTPGFGLGLSIAHRIVERHGGKILVESAPGLGSVFQIYLPIQDRSAQADNAL